MDATENFAKPADPPVDMLAELAALRDNANTRLERVKEREVALAAIIPVHENGAVSATFDEQGLLVSLTIDAQLRTGLDAAALQRDISIAIANADRPTSTPSLPAATDATATAGFITSILAGLTSGLNQEPVVYSNDLATVTVTSMWGELFSVECAPSWLSASTDASISDEVVRVVNLALRADDPLNKRKVTL